MGALPPLVTARQAGAVDPAAGAGAAKPGAPADGVLAFPAIFTSIRTPTGEGYRIIAASKALRPEERQAITRHSPSHDAMCDAGAETALACYPLPTGRICAAYTCPAGQEHTGRGGPRVYTYNLVLEAGDFARLAFNPFAILRAAADHGWTTPQLKVRDPLEPVRLAADARWAVCDGAFSTAREGLGWKRRALDRLLKSAPLVVHVESDAARIAESVWMAIPGPLRARLSLSAGLKFSTSRAYHLVIVSAPDARARELCKSRDALWIDAEPADPNPPMPAGAWLDLAEAHWRSDRIGRLASRTSACFEDCSAPALERTARLYLAMDESADADLARLLTLAESFVALAPRGTEGRIHAELVETLSHRMSRGLDAADLNALRQNWPSLSDLWRKSAAGRAFCEAMVRQVLSRVAAASPLEAARMALAVAPSAAGAAGAPSHDAFLAQLLATALAAAPPPGSEAAAQLQALADLWRSRRPDLLPPPPAS